MKKLKRAFTIVELVIVIAVIAILAAVLIPTFSNIIRKANVSSDTQLVRNLNTALAVDSAINGKHKTMHSALESAFDAGYDLEKINARANQNEILWDSVNDVFCYFDNGQGIIYTPDVLEHKDAEEYQYWRIVDAMPTDGKEYSLYASNKFNVPSVPLQNIGFDAGSNKTIESISYTGTEGRDVTIRTNGGTLTVNASTDTVRHYGSMDSLNIIAVANASYHENGSVKFMEIKTGRIVLETDSEVNHIHVNKNEAAQQGENAFASVTIAKATSVEMPNLSRDDVEIAANGTLVVALQEGTDESADKDYVWLTKQGVYEQIKVSDSATSAGEVWVNTSDKSEETKEAAQQIANNIASTVTVGENTYGVTVDDDRELILAELDEEGEIAKDEEGNVTKAFDVAINDEGQTVVTVNDEEVAIGAIEEVADKETVQTGVVLFAGGTGTEKDPYLISNRSEMENMSEIKTYSYFKWVGPRQIDASNWSSSVYLCGSFDGNEVVFNNLDCFLFRTVINGSASGSPEEDTVNTYKVANLTINANIVHDGWTAAVVRTVGVHNFVMENVTVHGYVEGATGVSAFICFGSGNNHPSYAYPGHITFVNCNSDAIIHAKSGNAVGFVAHAMHTSGGSIELINSNYTGEMSAPSISACKYICGNWLNGSATDDQSSQKNNIIYKTADNGWTYRAEGKTGTFTITAATLPENIGDVFTLEAVSNATTAVISIIISPNPGNMTSTYLSEEVEITNGLVISNNVKYFTVRVNASGVAETGVHGNYFDIVNSLFNGKLGSSTIVRITQYNASGSILSITNFNFNDATK